MSKTNRQHLSHRIDAHVYRRHTNLGYDRLMELARLDFARQVAYDVSPGERKPSMPTFTFASSSPFGLRRS